MINQITIESINKSLTDHIFDDTEFEDLNNYILQNKIGNGSFAKVYKVKDKETEEIFAAKISKIEINCNDREFPNLIILQL